MKLLALLLLAQLVARCAGRQALEPSFYSFTATNDHAGSVASRLDAVDFASNATKPRGSLHTEVTSDAGGGVHAASG